MYEEARQAGLNPVRIGVGYDEDGREWDEKADSFGCDFYEECCGEGCVYGEIGPEECFWLYHNEINIKYHKKA